ncbi:MAG TPA: hypothetical protein GX717_10020 [Clostridiaceae bacterium]|nr:hypothetical protein [Clostridiaceae bacterium]HHX38298.1 hypothetical protein [Clostridiaceae bacterium]
MKEVNTMSFDNSKLWEILEERKMYKEDLRIEAEISLQPMPIKSDYESIHEISITSSKEYITAGESIQLVFKNHTD